MNKIFKTSLEHMNIIKRRAHRAYSALSILRAAAVAALVTALWTDVAPANQLLNILIGLATFIAIIRFSSLGRTHKIEASSMLLALDMQHPGTQLSPFLAAASEDLTPEWDPRLLREEKRLQAWENRRLTTLAGSLLVPGLMAALLISKAPINVTTALVDAKNVLTALTGGMTLDVLEGAAPKADMPPGKIPTFSLSTSSPPEIDLIPSNMLKLTLVRIESSGTPPVINLVSLGSSSPLTIQMSPAGSSSQSGNIWTLEFSASESSDLIIPTVSSKHVARLIVKELPIPKVQLSLATASKDPWPDNELLPLSIQVSSVHPLDKVQLKIISKSKTSQESVLNITGDTTTISTTYNLNLQPWMEEDVLEFDIVAEAIDRAEPNPLVGKSPPLHVKVASAYGRYRNSLETLKQVKTMIDDARSAGRAFPAEATETMKKVLTQSEGTPFFDGIDRMELARMAQSVQQTAANPSTSKTQTLSDDLGQFLLEHEILDDRERDRDFFIAIRAFSRTLDSPMPERASDAKYLGSKMTEFLDARYKRWAIRVNRLSPQEPSGWGKVLREKPFHKAVREATQNSEVNPKSSQGALSSLASQYRAWIEELEAKEDQLRAKQEQERQQGLANARNDLRELQQRQDQISTNLDRATEHSQQDMAQKWPSSRMNENTNSKQAKALLNKLKTLSPTAGERLEAAIDSMDLTTTNGEASNWAEAEGKADMAGRLLRDADQAAGKSQKQTNRGRRRKTGGDDYHGTSVGGQVEIKSEYRVDPRYREEILRDVEGEMTSGENKNILDGWLRQVVR